MTRSDASDFVRNCVLPIYATLIISMARVMHGIPGNGKRTLCRNCSARVTYGIPGNGKRTLMA
jgi:hypothetical protein